MPTERDYQIATLMGENNRGTAISQQGILDVIENRRSDPTQYGASRGASIRDIVTANNGRTYQFDAFRPTLNGQPNGQFTLTTQALQGRSALPSEAARAQYDRAAAVVDAFNDEGVGRGLAQGGTFYQTPDAPNPWQRQTYWGRYGTATVGDHIYTGPGMTIDVVQYAREHPGFDITRRALADAPLPPTRPEDEGIGAGVAGGLTNFSNAITSGLEAAGNAVRSAADTVGGFFTPYLRADVQTLAPQALATGLLPDLSVNATDGGTFISNPPTPPARPFGIDNGATAINLGSFSGSFNPSAYLAANADVAANADFARNPFSHYLQFGDAEGRALNTQGQRAAPGAFDFAGRNVSQGVSNGTLRQGLSLPALQEAARVDPVDALYETYLGRDAAMDPGAQALMAGLRSGSTNLAQAEAQLRQSPEAQAYLAANPNLAPILSTTNIASLLGPSSTSFGIAPQNAGTIGAGQAANGLPPGFNEQAYYAQNPDVAASGIPATEHFLNFGAREGRMIGPGQYAPTIPAGQATGGLPPGYDFNADAYLRANPDIVAAGVTPQQALGHFTRHGFGEGRALDPSGLRLSHAFDGNAYLAQNPDVASMGLNPLEHFINSGSSEGRQPVFGSFGFGGNVSAGVGNGSFGAGISNTPPMQNAATIPAGPAIQPIGVDKFGQPIGAGQAVQATSLGNGSVNAGAGAAFNGAGAVNLVMGAQPGRTVSDTGFSTANVGGFDVNGAGFQGGQPADWSGAYRPGFTGYRSPEATRSSGISQQAAMSIQANNANLAAVREAASDFNRENIYPGAPIATAQQGIFNPYSPSATPTNTLNIQPTLAPAPFIPAAPALPRPGQGAPGFAGPSPFSPPPQRF